MSEKQQFKEYLFLLSIVVLSAGLRFYQLGEWSLWNDEAHTIEVALAGIGRDVVGQSVFYPLNFLLTAWSFDLFGISELSARLFPCLFGILTIPAAYWLGKVILDHRVGLLTALFMALYTWHIDWSQNARHYAMECFWVVISSAVFFKGIEDGKWKLVLVSPWMLLLAILTHPSAGFIVIAFVIYLAIVYFTGWDRSARYQKNVLLFLAPFLLIGIVLLPWYIKLPTFLLREREAVSSPFYILLNVAYHIQLPLLILGIAAGIHLVLRKNRRGVFVVCCVTVPLAFLLAASLKTLAYGVYVFYTLPFYSILAAYACMEIFRYFSGHGKIYAYAVIIMLTLVLVSEDYLYFVYENGNRARWKEASLFVEGLIKDGDVVFASEGSTASFYLGHKAEVLWTAHFKEAQEKMKGKKIWFLIYNENISPPLMEVSMYLRDACRFMREFTVNTSVKIRNINVYQCEQKGVKHVEGVQFQRVS